MHLLIELCNIILCYNIIVANHLFSLMQLFTDFSFLSHLYSYTLRIAIINMLKVLEQQASRELHST